MGNKERSRLPGREVLQVDDQFLGQLEVCDKDSLNALDEAHLDGADTQFESGLDSLGRCSEGALKVALPAEQKGFHPCD